MSKSKKYGMGRKNKKRVRKPQSDVNSNYKMTMILHISLGLLCLLVGRQIIEIIIEILYSRRKNWPWSCWRYQISDGQLSSLWLNN